MEKKNFTWIIIIVPFLVSVGDPDEEEKGNIDLNPLWKKEEIFFRKTEKIEKICMCNFSRFWVLEPKN